MKKFFILYIILLMANCSIAQSCLPDGITFTWQAEIDSFQYHYPGCTKIEGDVTIAAFDITNLNGLSVLTSFGGNLSIYIGALSSFAGLENVTSIENALIIQNNDSLTSMAGLENLTFIGGGIWFQQIHSLASLTGLDNATIRGNVWIIYNDSLSECAVKSICDYIAGGGGPWFEYNATGCNSQAEVEAACPATDVESLIPEPSLIISPNPASSVITIKTTVRGQLTILAINGQKLLQQQINQPGTMIDISTLIGGVYFVSMIGEKGVQVGKIIKN